MTTEVQRLRAQAGRCLRLANAGMRADVSEPLRALAIEYLEKAQALERAADQQQQQQAGFAPPPPPEPDHRVAQQQQQVQPDKADDTE